MVGNNHAIPCEFLVAQEYLVSQLLHAGWQCG